MKREGENFMQSCLSLLFLFEIDFSKEIAILNANDQ
jgi:hypothetical protein